MTPRTTKSSGNPTNRAQLERSFLRARALGYVFSAFLDHYVPEADLNEAALRRTLARVVMEQFGGS
jgi:hypothetical protein